MHNDEGGLRSYGDPPLLKELEHFTHMVRREPNMSEEETRANVMQLKAAVSVLQDQGDSQARRVRSLERQVKSLSVAVAEREEAIERLTKAGEDLHLRLGNLWGKVEICEGVLDGR